jgi:hypothetical protein
MSRTAAAVADERRDTVAGRRAEPGVSREAGALGLDARSGVAGDSRAVGGRAVRGKTACAGRGGVMRTNVPAGSPPVPVRGAAVVAMPFLVRVAGS